MTSRALLVEEAHFGRLFCAYLEGGESIMPGIKIREGESFEQALRRFKKQCEKAGILSELRKREHYEKPSIKKKKKKAAAVKKRIRGY